MTIIKPAATIMLARAKGTEIEVLLLKRNKALKFAAGLWVFPGGKIEPYEIEIGENDLEAARLAAVRETKEEANVDIETDSLVFFSHWTTPRFEPRRFATWFFFSDVSDQDLQVQVDNSEIKNHVWLSPQTALDRVKNGELMMMPPTYVSLQRIRKCKTIEAAKLELTCTPPTFILPVLELKDKKMHCLYEGDAGYETGDASIPGARHRMIANTLNGDFVFEYSDCESVFPVNGGMHK